MKQCRRCEQDLPVDAFAKDRQKRDGLCAYCRTCHAQKRRPYEEANREAKRAYDREYYGQNRDAIRQRAAQWRKDNPERVATEHAAMKREYRERNRDRYADYAENRRARVAEQLVENVDRVAVFERDGGRCHICGNILRSVRDMHLDHLVPISKGGEHSYRNVAVACAPCNIRRGDGRIPAQLRLTG